MVENIAKEYEQNKNDIFTLRNAHKQFKDATASSTCDKSGFKFSDNSFCPAFELNISFNTWRGYYGDSGCSAVIDFNNVKKIKELFIACLNENRDFIFNKMADMLEEENKKTKEQTILKLKTALKELQ